MDHNTGFEAILQALVRNTALRHLLEERGLDRELDHIAKGGKRAEPYRLLRQLEDDILRLIKHECGIKWATQIRDLWKFFKITVIFGTTEVQYASGTPLTNDYNFLALSLETAFKEKPGLDIDSWLLRPFDAWVDFLSWSLDIKRSVVKSRICDDANLISGRNYDRWIAGNNIRKLPGGHRAMVLAATGLEDDLEDSGVVDYLTGWLLLTIGLQSMPVDKRQSLPRASRFLGRPSRERVDTNSACRFVEQVTLPYLDGELQGDHLERNLDSWQADAERHPMIRIQHGRLRARLAAERGEDARALYEAVIDLSATDGWHTEEHRQCLMEALAYSHRVGSSPVFKRFWDRARKSALYGLDMDKCPSKQELANIDLFAESYPLSIPLARIYEHE